MTGIKANLKTTLTAITTLVSVLVIIRNTPAFGALVERHVNVIPFGVFVALIFYEISVREKATYRNARFAY